MANDIVATFILLVVGFGFGIGAFFYGFFLLQRKRLIEDTPTSKVRSIAMGFAEVYGKVSACINAAVAKSGVLKSPIDGAECVYYDTKVEELRQSGKSSHWETIYHKTDRVNFNASDETGTLLVDPAGATFDIRDDFHYETGLLGGNMSKNCIDFCARNWISTGAFTKSKRFTERYLAPGNLVYILGTAMGDPYADPSKVGSDNVMIAKGTIGEKTFYISDSGEKEILKKLHWSVPLCVFGGAALSVGCLAVLVFLLRRGF